MDSVEKLTKTIEELYNKEQYFQCIEHCDELLGINRKNTDAFFYKIKSYISVGFYNKAYDEFQLMESMNIGDARFNELKIETFLECDKKSSDLNLEEKIKDPSMALLVAKKYYDLDNREELEKWCKYAISLGANEGECTLLLIRNSYNNRQYKVALNLCKEALKKNLPYGEVYHYFIGKIMLKGNEIEEAFGEYREALKINPKYFYALRECGVIYFIEGKYNKALKTLEEAYSIQGEDEKLLIYLLKVTFKLKKYTASIKYCDEYIKKFPNGYAKEDAYIIWAENLYYLDEYVDAKNFVEKVEKNDTNRDEINDLLYKIEEALQF